MPERRCIAMGRGSKERPHFNLYDIDTHEINLDSACARAPQALVIKTARGYHFITPPNAPIVDAELLKMSDPKCPGNAVRFYPHDDLELIQQPYILCRKVAKIYESVFNMERLPKSRYEECDEPLKFGIYVAEKDGIKLHGEERHT